MNKCCLAACLCYPKDLTRLTQQIISTDKPKRLALTDLIIAQIFHNDGGHEILSFSVKEKNKFEVLEAKSMGFPLNPKTLLDRF